MVLTQLTRTQLRQVISEAVRTGVSHKVSSPVELAKMFGYNTSGRGGAVANRVKIEGKLINKEQGYDFIGEHFPQFTALPGYEA